MAGRQVRIGQGSDIHPLAPERPLYLGGIEIPDHAGLLGHSDGDCLIHALIDALLGAAGMGDIGQLFPDTDAAYRDSRSLVLLEDVVQRLAQAAFRVENVDLTVHCKSPRLDRYKAKIQQTLAAALTVDPKLVNVKAKSDNGLGPAGEGRAISAEAIVMISIEE